MFQFKPYFAFCLLFVVLGGTLFGLMRLQGGGPPPSFPWHVDDNGGPDVLFVNSGKTPRTVVVTNLGPDSSIKVCLRNASGGVVLTQTLSANDSAAAVIPKGGRVTVEDQNDPDELHGAGSWTFQ